MERAPRDVGSVADGAAVMASAGVAAMTAAAPFCDACATMAARCGAGVKRDAGFGVAFGVAVGAGRAVTAVDLDVDGLGAGRTADSVIMVNRQVAPPSHPCHNRSYRVILHSTVLVLTG